MRYFTLIPVFLLLFCHTNGQSFNPPVGIAVSTGTGTWNMSPAAACSGAYIAGAIWCTTTVDFNNAFTLTFQANDDIVLGSGADGICIVFGQNLTATSINGNAGYLGYYNPDTSAPNPQFQQSFGVEFDLFNDYPIVNDPSSMNDHTMITRDGNPYHVTPGSNPTPTRPSGTSTKDGTYHNYKINWCPASLTLTVYFEDSLRITSNFDYRTIFSGTTAVNWGITAGIGSSCSDQLIKNINLVVGTCTAVALSCNTLSMPDSLNLCISDTATIPATLTGADTVLSILWTPATGLSNTTILDPLLTATTSGWYYLTVNSLLPGNLVVNGNFSAGNTGFTSSYSYVSGPGSLVPAGVYAITTNPYLDHPSAYSFGDHTTGTGNMMAINGASTPISVWCETILVTPNTNYDFSAWFANWSSDTTTNLPLLQFQVNGVLLGSGPFTFPGTPGLWTQFNSAWNSGTNTSATICIYDEQTAADGNDFAIDDILFEQLCIAKDSVYVAVSTPDTTYMHTDTTVCGASGLVTLYAPAGFTWPTWSTGATTSSIAITGSGNYWVAAIGSCTLLTDTFNVTAIPLPIVSLPGDTSICEGYSVLLSSPESSGTYLWSTGSTNPSITVSTGGTYVLTVTSNGCSASASVTVSQLGAPVAISLGPDTVLCTGDIYNISCGNTPAMWSTGAVATNITVTDSGTYWASVTNACGIAADSVNVDFVPCDLFFPSAFTPNGDNRNDIARAVGYLSRYRNYSLGIYNRWGQRVFYTEDIYSGWDGTFNGVKQELDVYFYLIEYTLEGNHHIMKGDLTLIR